MPLEQVSPLVLCLAAWVAGLLIVVGWVRLYARVVRQLDELTRVH